MLQRTLKITLIAGAAITLGGVAHAAAPDVAEARAIIDGCVAYAKENGHTFSISVVDEGGHQLAFQRMDGGNAGTAAFALEKAKAAATWGFSTAGMAEGAQNTPGFANAPYVVTVAGGVPIYAADGSARLGGVGVSGAAPSEDAKCATAGVTAAGFKVSR